MNQRKGKNGNYIFLGIMLLSIIAGAVVGWVFPSAQDEEGNMVRAGATVLKPLGTLFMNLMFCIIVPMVFSSISSAVANIKSRRRAGKIMALSVITFIATGIIAGILMYGVMRVLTPYLGMEQTIVTEELGEVGSLSEILLNFITVSDFSELLSSKNMLPLIVFSILFGLGVNLAGGKDTPVAVFLENLAGAMMKMVRVVTYYAPVAFFGFFANLVATYGPQIVGSYGRVLLVYYVVCFLYFVTAFPLFARFGGGKGAVREMFRHILKPALMSWATCSSIATIPTNMEEAEETRISKDVSEIVLPLGQRYTWMAAVCPVCLKSHLCFAPLVWILKAAKCW